MKVYLLETNDYDYHLHGIFATEKLAYEARTALIENQIQWVRKNSFEDPDYRILHIREEAEETLMVTEATLYEALEDWVTQSNEIMQL